MRAAYWLRIDDFIWCLEASVILSHARREKIMRSRLVIAVVLALGVFATRYFVRAQVPASSVEHQTSRIVIGDKGAISGDSTEFDFGTVWVGGRLCHTFVLANEGSQAYQLKIISVWFSQPILLFPNSEAAVKFCVNSAKLSGRFEKHLPIQFTPIEK